MTHLTDEDLQAYINGDGDNAKIEKHLNSCHGCCHSIEIYRLIDKSISSTPRDIFSRNFDEAVIEQIQKKSYKRIRAADYIVILLGLFGVTVILGCLYLVPELKSIIFQALNMGGKNALEIIGDNTANGNLIKVLLFSFIIIAFYAIIDKIALKRN